MSNPGGKPTNLSGSSNLSSSFNSGLNTFGLNNSYGNNNGFSSGANSLNNSPQFNSTNNSLNNQQKKELPSWLGKLNIFFSHIMVQKIFKKCRLMLLRQSVAEKIHDFENIQLKLSMM